MVHSVMPQIGGAHNGAQATGQNSSSSGNHIVNGTSARTGSPIINKLPYPNEFSYDFEQGQSSEFYSSDTSASDGGVTFQEDRDDFDVELFNPSNLSMRLPQLHYVTGDNRWVTIKVETGRDFLVYMKRIQGNRFVFEKGWSIVCAVEALAEGQVARFQMLDKNCFYMWNDDYNRPNGPTGFSPAIRPPGPNWGNEDYILSNGLELGYPVVTAMNEIWAASSTRSKMYACVILPSHLKSKSLFFPKKYSKTLPQQRRAVALRCVGSSLSVPGAIVKDSDGFAYVTTGWRKFAELHDIRVGEVFIFRIHHGPSTWEFIACRSTMIVV